MASLPNKPSAKGLRKVRLDIMGALRPQRAMATYPVIEETGVRIAASLNRASAGKRNFWDFREVLRVNGDGALYQYPAMMVPELQKQVIASILEAVPEIKTIADPFVGSGTVLAQAMLAGKCFVGLDINPLAILLCRTRLECLNAHKLERAAARVAARILRDKRTKYAVRFKSQAKWFTRGANIGLSRIRRAILDERGSSTRLFMWTCLAETIRCNSNSRTSTYKLHVRKATDRNTTVEDVLTHFQHVTSRNVERVREFADELKKLDRLDDDGVYRFPVVLKLGDAMNGLPPPPPRVGHHYDMVVTSPPYGDNATTVPYGQAAWLPLLWVDLSDIDAAATRKSIARASSVDASSLGGRRSRNARVLAQALSASSVNAGDYIKILSTKKGNGLSRFVHFARDLNTVVGKIALRCQTGTIMVWTVGSRRIRGEKCPLMDIIADLFRAREAKEVFRIRRVIPTKRMPTKNRTAKLINEEFVSVLRFSCLANQNGAESSLA